MCGGGGSAPKVEAPPVSPAVIAPIEADETVKTAGTDARRRRAAAFGKTDTITTSGSGLSTEGIMAGSNKTQLGG